MDYNNKSSVEKNVGAMNSEAFARSGQLYQDIQKNSEQSAVVPFNPLQLYLFEIKQYSLLTREEEIEVAIQLRENNDEEAAFRLITSNLRLVVKIALDFHRNWAKKTSLI
jgi:DNA-directed RNA polymerase sigma subunit (sigma70/sigma32)